MKSLLFTLILFTMSNKMDLPILDNKITFTYHSFSVAIGTPNNTYLMFSIKNNLSDTIYLTRKNIRIRVTKDKLDLKDQGPHPFPPYFGSDEEYEGICTEKIAYQNKMNLIKNKYATRLYYKNFKPNARNKIDKKGFIELIANQCIVILPKQTINYSTFFHHNKFDKACKVTACYIDNGIFTSYNNNDNKMFYVKY